MIIKKLKKRIFNSNSVLLYIIFMIEITVCIWIEDISSLQRFI